MIWTSNLPFVVEVHVIMLVCCYSQENHLRSSLKFKDLSQKMPYSLEKDFNQHQQYSFKQEDDLSGNGRKTYQTGERINHRCKGMQCIYSPFRAHRHHHHHKKQYAYHNNKTYHKHKKSENILNISNPSIPTLPIKSYKYSPSKADNNELTEMLYRHRAFSISQSKENNFFEKLINSNNGSVAIGGKKKNKPDIEMDFFSSGNKQKIIDSKLLSAKNDSSNFSPNLVSGLNRNFVQNNQTDEKSKTLDESIKQILQKEDISLYFPSRRNTKDADIGGLSLAENRLLTNSLDKKINYEHSVSNLDQRRNDLGNSYGEFGSIIGNNEESKNALNGNNQYKKLEMRKLINVAVAKQIGSEKELIKTVNNTIINISGDTGDSHNNTRYSIKSHSNKKYGKPSVSYLHQKAQLKYSKPTSTDNQCYSISDLLMVVLITSLANIFAGFIITLTMCCISPRLRLLSSLRRTTESFSIGITHSRLNLSEDEISGNVGCLEACLPDISYQRHVARDLPKKIYSRKLNSYFQNFHARRRGPTLIQPGLQRYNSLHTADESPLVPRKSVSLEDLRDT